MSLKTFVCNIILTACILILPMFGLNFVLQSNSSIQSVMNSSLVISQHVMNTIRALPKEEREIISNALAREFLLGVDPEGELSPFQAMLYSVIRYYVKRDNIA